MTGIDALDAEIDRTRCDTGFNDSAYRKEAKVLGVDTRWAGNPPAVAGAATSSDGHMHGSQPASAASTPSTQPDPFGGRGSSGLDHLVSATGLAATSEIEAAGLIAALSEASEQDYAAWGPIVKAVGKVRVV